MVDALWVMLPRLQAEEQLFARSVEVHPHLDPGEQRAVVRDLQRASGSEPAAHKATHADLRAIGIKVKEQ